MTKYEVKLLFENLKQKDRQSQRRCDMLKELRADIYSLKGVSFDTISVQGGQIDGNAMDRALERLEKAEQECDKLIDEYVELRLTCIKLLDLLGEELKADILRMRYFKYMTVEEIANSIGYSLRHTYVVIDKSFKEISGKYQ